MSSERYERGLAVRREVLGSDYVDRAVGSGPPSPLQQYLTEFGWGWLWTRDELPRRTRSLINIALLTAMNRPHELAVHTRGAVNNGCAPEEIREAVMHCAGYAGAPAAVDGMRIVDAVLAELADERGGSGDE